MVYELVRSISLIPVAGAVRQRRFVEVTANGVNECDTASQDSIGVTLEASPAGNQTAIPIALLDGAKVEVEAAGAIAVGTKVATDTQGRAIAVASAANVKYLGVAVTPVTAAGGIVTIVGSKESGHAQQ